MLLIETGDVEGHHEEDNGMDYGETTGYNCCVYWKTPPPSHADEKCDFGALGQKKCTAENGKCGGAWKPMKISFFVKHNLRKYTCEDYDGNQLW